MIHPDLLERRTLIFDMDGTLLRSGDLAKHALRGGLKAFYKKKGENAPTWSDEALHAAIGKPAHEFYRSLLAEKDQGEWEELHAMIFEREKEWMESNRITFPGTIHTLETLKRRGYKLALVSNCSSEYLQVALDSQGLRRFFEIAVCIGDKPGKNKADLIGETVKQLGGEAVVIGDRDYDIDAAKANDLPAVGALYGYGNRDELMGTDTWVEDIRDLTYLFYPLRELATRFAIQIGKQIKLDRPIVVGLSGTHSSLTAELAMLMVTEIADNKIGVTHLKMDRHRISSTRKKASHWIEESYPWRRLEDHILTARKQGKIDTAWPLTDGPGDQPYRGRPGSVVLVEGPFLFGPHLRESFDFSIYVDSSLKTVPRHIRNWHKSVADRAVRMGGSRAEANTLRDASIQDQQKEWEAFLAEITREYLRTAYPSEHAEKVVSGTTLQRGHLAKGK
ncbi:HAD-IA family hydrolase [bacterium]|nr:HAD-IA family hydrolase [bacterium]